MASAVVDAIKTVCKVAKNSTRPRIALLTPYITPVHRRNIEYLNENGIDVISEYNLGFKADKETTSMSPESIFKHIKCLSKLNSNIDAVFIGCSAFRATGISISLI
jgi:maleate cis-trans isomerase